MGFVCLLGGVVVMFPPSPHTSRIYYSTSYSSHFKFTMLLVQLPVQFPSVGKCFCTLPYTGIADDVAVMWVGPTFALSQSAFVALVSSRINKPDYYCWCKKRKHIRIQRLERNRVAARMKITFDQSWNCHLSSSGSSIQATACWSCTTGIASMEIWNYLWQQQHCVVKSAFVTLTSVTGDCWAPPALWKCQS